MLLTLLFATLCCISFKTVTSKYECYEAFECSEQSIVDSSSDGDIECYGAYSCLDASSVRSTRSADIKCHGAFSCNNAGIIRTNIGEDIYCYGLYSCANTSNRLSNGHGDINCYGEKSCYDNVPVIIEANGDIHCFGLRSCASTDITSNDYLRFRGALSAQDATIRNEDYSLYIYLHGYDALYNGEIICDSVCVVYCYSGGCNNAAFSCQDGEGTCTVTTGQGFNGIEEDPDYEGDCIDALKSDLCPNGYELPNKYQIPSLADMEFSTYDNSFTMCNDPDSSNCGDYKDSECSNNGILDRSGEMNAICCSGMQSCKNATSIITNIDNTNDDIAIRIDGAYAANDVSGTITANNGGDIYLTGGYAMFGTSLNDAGIISNNGNHDIIVSGAFGAYAQIINNAKHLYCLASQACSLSQISGINGDIYGYGYGSLQSTSILDVKGDIYCVTYAGCIYFDASNVGGNIIGVGYRVMYQSDLNNVDGTVLAYGYQSLYESMLNNVSKVLAMGEECLASVEISGISFIDVNGDSAMDNSLIMTQLSDTNDITNITDTNTFTLRINGTNTQSFDIYCNATDTCRIKCLSQDACTLMNLYCIGTCYIDCNLTSSVECPTLYGDSDNYYYSWITVNPTVFPTDAPTSMPTAPTDNPTNIPTQPTPIPSVNPLFVPTSDPTFTPTEPTVEPSMKPTINPSSMPSNEPSSEPTSQAPTSDVVTSTMLTSNVASAYPTNYPSYLTTTTLTTTMIIDVNESNGEHRFGLQLSCLVVQTFLCLCLVIIAVMI